MQEKDVTPGQSSSSEAVEAEKIVNTANEKPQTCKYKSCKWAFAFLMIAPLGVAGYTYWHFACQTKALTQKIDHLEKKYTSLQIGVQNSPQKLDDKEKPTQFFESLLGAIQKRLSTLEAKDSSQLIENIGPILLYLDKNLNEDGKLLPYLTESLKQNVPENLKADAEDIDVFFKAFTAPRQHLKAHLKAILQDQQKTESSAHMQEKSSFWDKMLGYFKNFIHIRKIGDFSYEELNRLIETDGLEQVHSILKKNQKKSNTLFNDWLTQFEHYEQAKNKLKHFEKKLLESLK
jgi:hypothetical protein